MTFIGELFGLSRPDPPDPPPVPETPDLEKIEQQERRRLANTGIESRILTSPLGVGSGNQKNRRLLGE
ncbi:hypothetical protein GWN91_06655 [Candidatus Saccharibacteria bacterium]|nr:hypothetical protein [Candidatus Saccharibacteria bacterium]NIW80287.1 hypothetical protein [Calditrichia bacterium]